MDQETEKPDITKPAQNDPSFHYGMLFFLFQLAKLLSRRLEDVFSFESSVKSRFKNHDVGVQVAVSVSGNGETLRVEQDAQATEASDTIVYAIGTKVVACPDRIRPCCQCVKVTNESN